MAEQPTIIRKKRRRWKYPLHWFVTLGLLVVAGAWGWRVLAGRQGSALVLPGYIAEPEVYQQESDRFLGKNSLNLDAQEKFQQASASISRRDFEAAAALLEESARQAALPVVFHDLGVVYVRMEDFTRASRAFNEALTRDPHYEPARENLARIGASAPVTPPGNAKEAEPNNTLALATTITLEKLVDGTIADTGDDVDWYRLVAPPAPRDRVKVDLSCRSKTLVASLSVMDDGMKPLGPRTLSREPGGAVSSNLSPRPGSTIYVRVEGAPGAGGAYTLVARALKAYDSYEPNDDLSTARKISPGEAVEANIMDGQDQDYYSFTSPRTGVMEIELRNLSTGLVPAMTSFSADMRSRRPAPEAPRPGAGLHDTIDVRENGVYYLQVQSRSESSGQYTLTVR